MTKAASLALCLALGCPSGDDRPPPPAQTSAPAPPPPPPVASASPSAEPAPSHDPSATAPPTPSPNVALPKESEGPTVLAWRPNGRMFAAGAGNKLALFPVDGGAPRALEHARAVLALAFSIQGDRLATVEDGGKVRVWDPSAGKLVAELPDAVPGEVHALAFSADGKLLAAAGGAAAVWNVDQKKKLCATEEAWIFDLAFTPDQGSLVTTGNGQSVRWESATCAKKNEATAQTGGTFGSWVSPTANHVAAAAPDGHGLSLYDGKSFEGIEMLAKSIGCKDHVGPVRFSRDGEILLASGSYRWFRSIRLDSLKTIAVYDVPRPDEVNQIVMFDDGQRLLVVRGDEAELVSAVPKTIAYEIPLEGAQTFDVSWDMKRLLGAGPKTAHVWDAATGKLIKSFPLPS